MLTIDFHTHLPGRAFGIGATPTPEFLGMLDHAGIDLAVVLTVDGFFYDPVAANNALHAQCQEAEGRLIPFCTVNPREPEQAVAEIRRCVQGLGMKGVKFHPWLQGFSVADRSYMDPICAVTAELGVPMIFHDGTPPYSTPLQIADVARRHPTLQVVLGHGGLFDLWLEAIAAAQSYENIWVCLCGSTAPLLMEKVAAATSPQRLLYGTDMGFGRDPYVAWHRTEQARRLNLPADVKAAMLGANAARLLGVAV